MSDVISINVADWCDLWNEREDFWTPFYYNGEAVPNCEIPADAILEFKDQKYQLCKDEPYTGKYAVLREGDEVKPRQNDVLTKGKIVGFSRVAHVLAPCWSEDGTTILKYPIEELIKTDPYAVF